MLPFRSSLCAEFTAMNRFEFCDETGDLYHSQPQGCTLFDGFQFVKSAANAIYQARAFLLKSDLLLFSNLLLFALDALFLTSRRWNMKFT
jgi:hypothetical protein